MLKSDRGRTACTRSSSGLHVHVRRKVEKHAFAWVRERHDDENCVHYRGWSQGSRRVSRFAEDLWCGSR